MEEFIVCAYNMENIGALQESLPNINRTQAAERAEKCRFCPWLP